MSEWKNKNTVHRKLQAGLNIKRKWEQNSNYSPSNVNDNNSHRHVRF